MKKFKKILAGIISATMLLTISASASTDDGVFTENSNMKNYTPYSCTVRIARTHVNFSNIKWGEYKATGFLFSNRYWECELRSASSGYVVSDAYSSATSVSGNFPNLYRELDVDDISIGTSDMDQLVVDKSYYANLSVTPGSKYDSGVELLVESETGESNWFGDLPYQDGIPMNYQVYNEHLITGQKTSVSW